MASGERPAVARRAFTLIELLVVIAIIVVLVGLLVPAINKARRMARYTEARNELTQIETALRSYYDEYRHWPMNLIGYEAAVPAENKEANLTGIEVLQPVVDMLSGQNINGQNPKELVFLDLPEGALNSPGDFVDPWDRTASGDTRAYKFMCDYNDDGVVHVEFTSNDWNTNLNRRVAVWSRGEDGSDRLSDGGVRDDVQSW